MKEYKKKDDYDKCPNDDEKLNGHPKDSIERKVTIRAGNMDVSIPESIVSKEDISNQYIEQILENASDSIEKAQKEANELEIKTEKIADTNMNEETNNETKLELETNSSKFRKLARYEKWILGLLVVCACTQLLLIAISPIIVCWVLGGVLCLLVLGLSCSCKHYEMVYVSALLMIVSIIIPVIGFNHGMIKKDVMSKSILEIKYLNENTHVKAEYTSISEDEMTSSFAGKFIYYYKYTCKDCTAVYAKVKALAESQGYEIIPIETRSETGKKFLKLYPVEEVPAGLVIKSDGDYLTRILYTVQDGQPRFDMRALKTLFDEIEKENKE